MKKFNNFKIWLDNLSYLTEKDYDLFEPFLTSKIVENKQIILSQGNICKEMGFISKGSFRIYYLLNDGKEINIQFCFENEFLVDFESFLHQKPSLYYIQALEKSEIFTFDLKTLINGYNKSKNWERFGRTMAEKVASITAERVQSFLFMDGEERYIHLLKTQPQIFERVPLYQIASYLGLERESLSRLRKKIAKK